MIRSSLSFSTSFLISSKRAFASPLFRFALSISPSNALTSAFSFSHRVFAAWYVFSDLATECDPLEYAICIFVSCFKQALRCACRFESSLRADARWFFSILDSALMTLVSFLSAFAIITSAPCIHVQERETKHTSLLRNLMLLSVGQDLFRDLGPSLLVCDNNADWLHVGVGGREVGRCRDSRVLGAEDRIANTRPRA